MIKCAEEIYENYEKEISRYKRLDSEFKLMFGEPKNEAYYFSSPGRTEICGNHTDHNRGKVLTAAIDLDIISKVAKNDSNVIRLKSFEYNKIDIININEKNKVEKEAGKSSSMIRGICSKCIDMGYNIGGFDAFTISQVLKGSGLSSSAAFEVLVVTIINHLFNDDKITPTEIAKISQYSENNYYGKPSGLMDQMASSLGGFMKIDFEDPFEPKTEKVSFDLKKAGYSLCIVDIGAGHADKVCDYAAIPDEMKEVALYFGNGFLNSVDENEFYKKLPSIRAACTDRAVLRAIHFFNENKRVEKEYEALKNGNMNEFLSNVNESGISSAMYLQNIYSNKAPQYQGLTLALSLSEKLLSGKGAWRVHGGGFGGTMQAFVPNDFVNTYKTEMEAVFGEGGCHILNIRPFGSCRVNL